MKKNYWAVFSLFGLLALSEFSLNASVAIAATSAPAAPASDDRCTVVTVIKTDCSCIGAVNEYVPTLEILTSDGNFNSAPLNVESDLRTCQAFLADSAMCTN